MQHKTSDPASPGQLYALRLSPPEGRPGLHGEIEHVVSGERQRFQHSAELVAWLERWQAAPGGGVVCADGQAQACSTPSAPDAAVDREANT